MPLPYLKRSFNSTMVRLKVTSFLIIQPHIPKFQFHNGSIKRTIRRSIERLKDAFQFHNGSIKRRLDHDRKNRCIVFQFHNGSIKSGTIPLTASDRNTVSIPQWFD